MTSGAISSTGDLLLQSREGRTPRDWVLAQTGRVACYRMVHGPAIDACWRWFDARLPFGGRGVALRVLADQLILMPPSMAGFFLSQGLLEGLSLDECVERVRDSFWPAVRISVPYITGAPCLRSPSLRLPGALANGVNNQLARRREQARGGERASASPTSST